MTVKKHNYICKYYNLPTTCFGLIRPSSGLEYSIWGKLSVWPKCRWEGGTRSRLGQTDNFPQMLYSNLKMTELGRNM